MWFEVIFTILFAAQTYAIIKMWRGVDAMYNELWNEFIDLRKKTLERKEVNV